MCMFLTSSYQNGWMHMDEINYTDRLQLPRNVLERSESKSLVVLIRKNFQVLNIFRKFIECVVLCSCVGFIMTHNT